MAVSPTPEQGVECNSASPDDCGLPRNAPILVRFDRYLLPSTAVRQSIRVFSGSEEVTTGLLAPEYDLVERTLVFRQSQGFVAGALYTVEFIVPKGAGDFGFRAFDGAPLAEGDVPLRFDFRARRADPPVGDNPERDVVPDDGVSLFLACASAGCHSRTDQAPRMGLDLSSSEGLLVTAVGKVAHQADTGPNTGLPLQNPSRFGVNMPLIDPGRPDNSYLIYKLLLRPENLGASGCTTRYPTLSLGANCEEHRTQEAARLREWFVRGQAMPLTRYASDPQGNVTVNDAPVPLETTRGIQAWIRGGAAL